MKNKRLYIAIFLAMLINPFLLFQTFMQLVGQLIALVRWKVCRKDTYAEPRTMALPFSGAWKVVKGGIDRKMSHSWSIVSQRYAYDFTLCNESTGLSYENDGRRLEDYYAFGQPILSPDDGIVVQVRNNVPDYRYPGTGCIDLRARDIRGNYVVIQHGKVYSLLAHLKASSCVVCPGARVRHGQVIGKCGSSGHSTEPHLHFQVQDSPNFFTAVGLPIKFSAQVVRENGSVIKGLPYEERHIHSGQVVRNSPTSGKDLSLQPEIVTVSTSIGIEDFLRSLIAFILFAVGIYFIYQILKAVISTILIATRILGNKR